MFVYFGINTAHHIQLVFTFTDLLGKLRKGDHVGSPTGNNDKTLDDLSSDLRFLLDMFIAFPEGKVSPNFVAWKIAELNHAWWLKLAIRLMCL